MRLYHLGSDATVQSTPGSATYVQTALPKGNGLASGPPTPPAAGPVPSLQKLDRTTSASLESPEGEDASRGVPVYVMLPLDAINSEGTFRYAGSVWFAAALETLVATGIHGVAVDIWWGAVERQPGRYDWSGYRQLFDVAKGLGLKIQAVMSFHACGGNVGDSAQVPLPKWVLKAGEADPDLFFTDRPRDTRLGQRNKEYVSLFADEAPRVLAGRSPLECYTDFMREFRDAFLGDLGGSIAEVVIGAGPCGELRYPSYVEANGWRFPGVGEFQCYDRRALASLAQAAQAAGHADWGYTGPHDCGHYNSVPEETGFFCSWGGSWDTPYGHFFLEWYSSALLEHGDRLLRAATAIFATRRPARCTLSNHTAATQRAVSGSGPSFGPPSVPPSSAASETALGSTAGEACVSSEPDTDGDGEAEPGAGEGEGQGRLASIPSDSGLSNMSSYTCGTNDDANGPEAVGARPLAVSSYEPAAAPGPVTPGGAELGLPPAGPSGGASGTGAPVLRRGAKSTSLLALLGGEGEAGPPEPPPSARSDDGERRRRRRALPDRPAGGAVEVTLKVSGVHWWYNSRSHAAELTAGYYNTCARDGYNALIELAARYGASVTLTCVEMCDAQHPPHALCGPEGLLRQVREAAAAAGMLLAGENALPCFSPGHVDQTALERIVYNTQEWGPPLQEDAARREALYPGPSSGERPAWSVKAPAGISLAARAQTLGLKAGLRHEGGTASRLPMMRSLTFLRLTLEMLSPAYQPAWERFMQRMRSNGTRGGGGHAARAPPGPI